MLTILEQLPDLATELDIYSIVIFTCQAKAKQTLHLFSSVLKFSAPSSDEKLYRCSLSSCFFFGPMAFWSLYFLMSLFFVGHLIVY